VSSEALSVFKLYLEHLPFLLACIYTCRNDSENFGPGTACRRTTTCLQRNFPGLFPKIIA
jgi:hypothetical protein